MSKRQHKSSPSISRLQGQRSGPIWCLLWLLPFLWTGTFGEVLHHYVELPAAYRCAVEEIEGASIEVAAATPQDGGTAKLRAHACHSHHGHDANHCSACRYLPRLVASSVTFSPTFTSKTLVAVSHDFKARIVVHPGRPVRGPPGLTI